MPWDERQRAMLAEMGIRLWSPASAPEVDVETAEAGAPAPMVSERSAPRPAAAPVAAERPAASSSPPAVMPASAAAAAATASSLAPADWLAVTDPFGVTAAGVDPVAAAEQERLLDNMLRAMRLGRAGGARDARAGVCHPGASDLGSAIGAVAPRGIVAFGRAAAVALLGLDEPLGRLRERVHDKDGVPVVVTFALAYLLRHPEDKAKAWADLCRAVAAVDAGQATS